MSVVDNIKIIEEAIASSCAKVNRDPDEVTLVAVSKQQSVEDILEAGAAGIRHFGENRVEEGMRKIPAVNERAEHPITWHMVGHVQSRKVKLLLPMFDVLHSVDSLRLGRRLSRLAVANGRTLDVLVEVNISGEASKFGFQGYNWYHDDAIRDRLWQDMRALTGLPGLRARGLMTMAPFGAGRGAVQAVFAGLFSLRETLSASLGMPLEDLSMGMTDDYRIAIEEGATMIRIGRAIFGERKA